MEEEISLIEIFETVKKNVKILLLFTILPTLLYISFTLLFESPLYEAVTLLTITETTSVSETGTIQKVGLPVSFYESLLRDANFIRSILKETKADGEISLKVSGERILKITVKSKTKEKAMDISERLIVKLNECLDKLRKSQGDGTQSTITLQKENLMREFDKAKNELTKFKMISNISILQQRIDDLMKTLSEYEIALGKIENDIKVSEESIKEIAKHFEKEKEIITLVKSLGTNPLLYEVGKEVNQKKITELMDMKLEEENINPVYQSLKARLIDTTINFAILQTKKKIITPEIEKTKIEINELKKELAIEEDKLRKLEFDYYSSKERYNELLKREDLMKTYASHSIGGFSITLPTQISDKPVGPISRKKIGITALIGFICGIGVSFIKESIKKYKEVEN